MSGNTSFESILQPGSSLSGWRARRRLLWPLHWTLLLQPARPASFPSSSFFALFSSPTCTLAFHTRPIHKLRHIQESTLI